MDFRVDVRAAFFFYLLLFSIGFGMDFSENQIATECKRCGTCCKKGGPALHDEDKSIIDRGDIPLTALYTIRKGEFARDNVNGGVVRLSAEIIKIKSRSDASACMYLNETDASCNIYDHRPIECRILECWNTKKIAAIYAHTRLTRRSILEKVDWLADLVQTHEAECVFKKIQDLVNAREAGEPEATTELIHLINYDLHLRNLVVEKGNVPSGMLNFLFGRPLSGIVRRQFGIKINRKKPG